MRKIHMLKTVAVCIAALAFILILANGSRTVTLSAALALAGAAVIWSFALKKQHQLEIADLHKAHEREMMRALSHYRHDWMNDLQVLCGYISLRKYDKLAPYLEKIKDKMSEESYIAGLGNTSLSLLLLSYRQYSQHYELHVTLDRSVNLHELPIRQDRLARLVKEGLQLFQHDAEPAVEEENTLELTFAPGDDAVQVIYRYTGLYAPRLAESLERWTSRLRAESVRCKYVLEDGQADAVLHIPFE
jgi:Signal transduction histidine kinase regulating citrate/malate metabolism